MKSFSMDNQAVRLWVVLIFILIMIPACVGVGGFETLIKGTKIPYGVIENYKKLPEGSSVLQNLREQAQKDPEGMLAAGLKCAGRLEPKNSGNKPKQNTNKHGDTLDYGMIDLKCQTDDCYKKDAPDGQEECYWKPPGVTWQNPFNLQQKNMTGSLHMALVNLGKSQLMMAKALDLDEQVILAEKNAKNLEAGDLGSSDEVSKSLEISKTLQEAIDKETAKKKILDAESKAVFATSIPFYIKGVTGAVQTGVEAVNIGYSLASLNPTAILQLGTLASIVENLPALVSQLSGSTGKIMDFMTANEIDDSEIKDKLSDVF